jgi:hypothetical protein
MTNKKEVLELQIKLEMIKLVRDIIKLAKSSKKSK